jgi:hypothetical protein
MPNIIFARPRHHYQGYDDFFRLVDLSGFTFCYLDQVDWYDVSLTVIATPKHPEWDSVIPRDHKCRLIWWTFERGHTDEPLMDMSNPFKPDYVDEVWASDSAFAASIGARYVFLGGHRAFGSVNVRDREYDYITLMAPFGRRTGLFAALAGRGLRNADLPGGTWGPARHERLMQSKLMISCHQDDLPWSEPIRFMIAACYGLPILSEYCQSSGGYDQADAIVKGSLDELPLLAVQLLGNDVIRARLAANAYRLVVTEHPFRREVEAAL